MKKLVLSASLITVLGAFGQNQVVDMQTGEVFRTELVEFRGKLGFYNNPDFIIGHEDPATAAAGGGGHLYNGPSERITTGPFGEEGMSIKICHNTNIWPCMYVRNRN